MLSSEVGVSDLLGIPVKVLLSSVGDFLIRLRLGDRLSWELCEQSVFGDISEAGDKLSRNAVMLGWGWLVCGMLTPPGGLVSLGNAGWSTPPDSGVLCGVR